MSPAGTSFPAQEDLETVRLVLGQFPAKTRLAYGADLMAFFRSLGNRRLSTATRDDVVAFMAEATSPGLRGRRLSALRAVFQQAGAGGQPGVDPTIGLRAEGRNAETRQFLSLSVAEVKSVVAAASRPRDRLALLLCYRGLKVAEVLALRWEHIRPEAGDRALRVSGANARYLPIDDELSRAITALQAVTGEETGPVFVSRTRGGVVTERSLSRSQAVIGDRVGVRLVSPGRLRNSFAQHAMAAGMPLELVHLHLGNRSMKSTADQASALARQHPKLSKARRVGAGLGRMVASSRHVTDEAADAGRMIPDHDFERLAGRLAAPSKTSLDDRLALLRRLAAELARREEAGEPPPPGHEKLPVLVPLSSDQVALLVDVVSAARDTMRARMAEPASSREAEFYGRQLPVVDGVAAVLRHFDVRPGGGTPAGADDVAP